MLFFFNPFDAKLMRQIIDNAIKQADATQSRILVVYYNPVHKEEIERLPELAEIKLRWVEALKMKFLSPYPALIMKN